MDAQRPPPGRFHLLDLLRGAAALAVVVYHYQHFYFGTGRVLPAHVPRSAQPFYGWLWPCYEYGDLAVPLFFVLSGFVFFYLYAGAVRTGRVGAWRYAVRRFARLYPLHLATLLGVAALQAVHAGRAGDTFVYEWNDATHFGLNLGLCHYWGFEAGFSFNGPSWSISVEALLYGVFFVVARVAGASILATGAMLALSRVLHPWSPPLADGLLCFYAGGAAWIAFDAMGRWPGARAVPVWVAGSALAGVVAAQAGFGSFRAAADARAPLLLAGVFPLTVLVLAAVQHRWPEAGRRFACLGDWSYAIYLLHFPLQLAVAATAVVAGVAIPAQAGGFFWCFLALVVVVAALTHRWFERPLRDAIRARLDPSAPTASAG